MGGSFYFFGEHIKSRASGTGKTVYYVGFEVIAALFGLSTRRSAYFVYFADVYFGLVRVFEHVNGTDGACRLVFFFFGQLKEHIFNPSTVLL